MSLIIVCVVFAACSRLTLEFYRRFWKQGLSVEVAFEKEQIEEGQVVVLREKLENRKKLPLLALIVKFQLDRSFRYLDEENTIRTDKQYRTDCISIMPYQRIVRSFEVMGMKRGFYQVDRVTLEAPDLLYQNIFIEHCDNCAWLYVYPSRSGYEGASEVFERVYGEYVAKRLNQEDPFEFRGIRDYTSTDPMRRVNWKISAKTGSLKVNQYFNTSDPQFTLFLNLGQVRNYRCEELLEESIRVARNFVELFIERGVPVRLVSNGRDKLTGQEICFAGGAGPAHIDFCLRQFARMEYTGNLRGMHEVLQEETERKGRFETGVSLLISAEQSDKLREAYLNYVGAQGKASWIIPMYASQERYFPKTMKEGSIRGDGGAEIRTEHLVMEQVV